MKKAILATVSATALVALSACGAGETDTEETVVLGDDEIAEDGDMAEGTVDGAAAVEADTMEDDFMDGDAMEDDGMETDATEGETAEADEDGGISISINRDGVKAEGEGVSASLDTDGKVSVD